MANSRSVLYTCPICQSCLKTIHSLFIQAMKTNSSLPVTDFPVNYFKDLSLINLTLSIYIIIQNSMIIYHYFKDLKRLSSLLFVLIAAVDIGSACSAIVWRSIALLGMEKMPSLIYVTNLSFGNLCYVTSTFLGMTLTVVKTINIINPFYSIRGGALKVCLAIFTSLGLVLSVFDSLHLIKISYYLPKWDLGFWISLGSLQLIGTATLVEILRYLFSKYPKILIDLSYTIFYIPPIFELCLPCLIVLVCMILQIVYIKRAFSQSADPRQDIANHVTVTVFLISLLYLSSISVYSWSLLTNLMTNDNDIVLPDYKVQLVGRLTLPLINAALFPTILILRKPELKATYRGYISTVLRLPVTVFYNIRHRARGYTDI